jgi:pimeloyl-ACP methyl ester carboxylesterase
LSVRIAEERMRSGTRTVSGVRRALALLLFLIAARAGAAAQAKTIPYGDNPGAGHYLQVGDAKIYYEVYGSGRPLVLLHGGLYGYIDEFSGVIPSLARNHTVIAIALRGHGKSELGNQPLSNALFAEDSAAVIRQVTPEQVDLVGFSVGAMAAYLLAARHPEIVRRLVAVGGPVDPPGSVYSTSSASPYDNPTELEKQLSPSFIARRNELYPDREEWNRLVIAMGRAEANGGGVSTDTLQAMHCPILIVAGDRDQFATPAHYADMYQHLQHAEFAVIPDCGHTVFTCNPLLMATIIDNFLQK